METKVITDEPSSIDLVKPTESLVRRTEYRFKARFDQYGLPNSGKCSIDPFSDSGKDTFVIVLKEDLNDSMVRCTGELD